MKRKNSSARAIPRCRSRHRLEHQHFIFVLAEASSQHSALTATRQFNPVEYGTPVPEAVVACVNLRSILDPSDRKLCLGSSLAPSRLLIVPAWSANGSLPSITVAMAIYAVVPSVRRDHAPYLSAWTPSVASTDRREESMGAGSS